MTFPRAGTTSPHCARLAATAVVKRLRDAGHTAYFAGGSVRDALLGLHPTDYDVATDATPPRVRSLFKRSQEVGEAFGVMLVILHPEDWGEVSRVASERVCVEVATFRADGPYSDTRRPDAVVFSDPRTDAERRDFTINALFIDPFGMPGDQLPTVRDAEGQSLGSVIDFVGGLADLNSKLIRAVGDPDTRLAEDHLRALRAVRFAARLGFAIDPGTSAAITRHASELRGVSRERIGDEIRRVLSHPSRAIGVQLLQRLGLDAPVLDAPAQSASTPLLASLTDPIVPTPGQLGLALAAWETDRHRGLGGAPWLTEAEIKTAVPRFRRALALSNDESDALRGILELAPIVVGGWDARPISERKRLASRTFFGAAMVLVRATVPANAAAIEADLHRLSGDGIGLAPHPVLTGDDLVAHGYKPGPAFKTTLDAVYDAQLEGRVRDKAGALELARSLSV